MGAVTMGAVTTGGFLALKNGLSPFARSAFAQAPTGAPLSPLLSKLVLANSEGQPVAVSQIADDGSLFPFPILLTGSTGPRRIR
jgi:hypothetical protein